MNVHEEHITVEVRNDEGLPPPMNGPSDAQMNNLSVGAGPVANGPTGNTFNPDRNIDFELSLARALMQDHIFRMFIRQLTPPVNAARRLRMKKLSIRLERCLFLKSFTEGYRNLETLQSRVDEHFESLRDLRDEPIILEQLANTSGVQGHQTGQVPNERGLPPPQNGPPHAQVFGVGADARVPAGGGLARNPLGMNPWLLEARVFIREHV